MGAGPQNSCRSTDLWVMHYVKWLLVSTQMMPLCWLLDSRVFLVPSCQLWSNSVVLQTTILNSISWSLLVEVRRQLVKSDISVHCEFYTTSTDKTWRTVRQAPLPMELSSQSNHFFIVEIHLDTLYWVLNTNKIQILASWLCSRH